MASASKRHSKFLSGVAVCSVQINKYCHPRIILITVLSLLLSSPIVIMLSLPDVALFLAVTCIPGIAAAPAPLNIAADLDALATKIDVALSGYAPVKVACPSTPLIRPAECLSANETAYIGKRQSIANTGLAAWLKKTNSAFKTTTLPSLGLTSSGGGYRALLNGAGVIQGLDGRDSDVGTSGLYQGLVYEAGLSGGGWLLSSIIGNNWPTVTSLKTGLWETAFEEGLALPDGALAALALTAVVDDIAAKQAAGYPVTIVDAWGRLLSYQLLYGLDGGVADQLSSVTSYSNFTSHNVPYPIITSRGVNTFDGQCYPQANATQYEFHPYEFGYVKLKVITSFPFPETYSRGNEITHLLISCTF